MAPRAQLLALQLCLAHPVVHQGHLHLLQHGGDPAGPEGLLGGGAQWCAGSETPLSSVPGVVCQYQRAKHGPAPACRIGQCGCAGSECTGDSGGKI